MFAANAAEGNVLGYHVNHGREEVESYHPQVRESSVLDRKRAAFSLVADCTNPQRPLLCRWEETPRDGG